MSNLWSGTRALFRVIYGPLVSAYIDLNTIFTGSLCHGTWQFMFECRRAYTHTYMQTNWPTWNMCTTIHYNFTLISEALHVFFLYISQSVSQLHAVWFADAMDVCCTHKTIHIGNIHSTSTAHIMMAKMINGLRSFRSSDRRH